jgi:prepilin-type N-terminal cleavage/methylation domain-containing protein/prepilin-type processing-associated H-X9-DG protein
MNRTDLRLGVASCGRQFGPFKNLAARTTCGLTLIELLIVVAVIGLLAAVLLPVLATSQSSVFRIKCVNNLRQLGLASQMYWEDHEGAAFRYKGAFTNGGDIYWFGWIEPWNGANEGHRRYDPRLAALYPYLQGRGLEVCPSLNYRSQFKLKSNGATYGYGYNRHLSPPASLRALNVNQLRHPGETALLADAAQVNTFQFPATPDHPLLEEFYYVSADEATAHFRHRRLANVVFCDGHVATEKVVPGSVDPAMPRQRVGRLRAEILRIR